MIEFDSVVKEFSGKPVLRGMSLRIEKGETVSLVGTSGAGKTVTIKHMVRLLDPTSGRIVIDGEEIHDLPSKELGRMRMKFGFLFQGAALLQWMSVFDNVALPLRENTRMPEEEVQEKVNAVLEKVGMTQAAEKLPADISGGMQKRAGLARAVVTEPDILLYDEPTSGLDPVTSRTIDQLIHDLQQDLGVTSVVVTHDMISALTISDRIAMLHEGQLSEISTPQDFLASENPVVSNFLDSQCISRNFFEEFSDRKLT
jgi:phospholipid/cholesterol/gamma-HCH transport system ATP-binding protein